MPEFAKYEIITMKTLVIAEKPSVADDLHRALGRQVGMTKFKRERDYFENDTHVISSAIGHLVELEMPKAQWVFESLPILPVSFGLQPIETTKDRLHLLRRLMKRKDVGQVINACDAGREGELIFHYLMEICQADKPVKRLWMQSMTNAAIQQAFNELREGQDMIPLESAALCRSESDWLVGINGTRAMTAFNSLSGGFQRTPVGRVQTPTLTLLVAREKEIRAFISRPYWEIYGDFDVASGTYRGRWFDPKFKKDPTDPHLKAERCWEQAEGEAIVDRCRSKTGIVEEKAKPSKQVSPLLYDLTTLQREASNRFGFSAKNTLGLAQALYERHKVLTYPRTDSRHLPEDYINQTKNVLRGFMKLDDTATAFPRDLPAHAGHAVTQRYVGPNKRIFDNAKISDHFAIVPTGQVPKRLKEQEMKIYDLVTRRFIAAFYPPAEYLLTQRITRVDQDHFKTDGKVLQVPGWLAVYGKRPGAASGKDGELVPVQQGEQAKVAAVEIVERETKPPPRYGEASLLSAMETAGKLVDDEELRSAMSERGLGTPATRAAIIEGLIQDKYVNRVEKELMPTQQGIRLVDLLDEMGVNELCSPELTGDWEYKLKQMEEGKLDRATFMKEIRRLTAEVVDKARKHAAVAEDRVYPDLPAACPACGQTPMKQDARTFHCATLDCNFKLWKNVSHRELQPAEAMDLLTSKVVGPLTGFRSRWGQPFDASLKLNDELKIEFVTQTDEERQADLAALVPENYICDYPPSGDKKGKIYEGPEAYILDLAIHGDKDFRRVRLKKEQCKVILSRDEAKKFFTEGRTSEIDEFISKKGRPFKAYLEMDPGGRRFVNWRFPAPAKTGGNDDGAPAKKRAAKRRKTATKKRAS